MVRIIQATKNEHGQSMVELALAITFLMVLLAGTVDLGRAFFTWLALRDAAQEGASYGSFKPTDISGIETRVYDNLEQVVRDPALHIDVSVNILGSACLDRNLNDKHTIQVDVDYPTFTITMPLLGTIIGSQMIPIHATINNAIISPTCP